MTHHNRATRLEHYLTTLMPETHGQQRKAFRDFVTALLTVRTCCQATLARYFPTFEAASRRLTRWLHNPRLDPLSRVGFSGSKGHLTSHWQFEIFSRSAGPPFGDETPR